MFDLSWAEIMLIGVVALFAFGPDDIPKMMYNAGKILRRLRYMRYAVTNQFETFMDDIEQKATAKPVIKNDEPVNTDPKILDAEAEEDADFIIPETMPEDKFITEADLPPEPDDRPDQPDQPKP